MFPFIGNYKIKRNMRFQNRSHILTTTLKYIQLSLASKHCFLKDFLSAEVK